MKNEDLGSLSNEEYQTLKERRKTQPQNNSIGESLMGESVPFLRGITKGATLGANRKIEASIAATILKYGMDDKRSFKDLYSMALKASPHLEEETAKGHKIADITGQLVGGSALPWKATSYKGAAATGAGYGGLAGIGSNTEGEVFKPTSEDFMSGAKGAAIGAPLGAIGQSLSNLFPKRAEVNPAIPAAMKQFEKNNIPFKKSDITENPADLLMEENAAIGGYGDASRANALQMKEQQREAFGNAQQKLHNETIGNGQPFIEKGSQANEAVNELTNKAVTERAPIQEAYDTAKKNLASLDIHEVNKFPDIAESILQNPVNGFSKSNAPLAYQQLKAFKELFPKSTKTDELVGVDFRGLETWRQGLNKAASGIESGQNKAGVNALKNSFDDWMDNTIERALIDGDSGVIDQFKHARKLNADWMNRYSGDSRNVGEKFVKDQVARVREGLEPYTPEQMVNKIFGVGELGFNNDAASIVKEMKKHIGPESLDLLRVEAGARLLKPLTAHTPNVVTYKNNLNKFLSENHTLAKELLLPSQIKELKDFGEIARKIYGNKNNSRLNPSGTDVTKRIGKFLKAKMGWISDIYESIKPSPITFDQKKLKKELLMGEAIEAPVKAGLRGTVPMNTTAGESKEQQSPTNYLESLSDEEYLKLRNQNRK